MKGFGEDAEAIAGLRWQAEEREGTNEQWARDITFRAEVGCSRMNWRFLRKACAGRPRVSADSITRVRWGGVRKSVNGIPTGTDYTIGFGDNRSEQVVEGAQPLMPDFDPLWRAVCVRLYVRK